MKAIEKPRTPTIIWTDNDRWIVKRWVESYGWYFVKDCLSTSDDRYASVGLNPVRQAPCDERYIQYLWAKSWKERRLAVNKFRQGFATNLFCVFRNMVFLLLIQGSSSYILKRSYKEADTILKTRIMNTYNLIPKLIRIWREDIGKEVEISPREILPVPEYFARDGAIKCRRWDKGGAELPPSFIYALEGTVEKARGITGSNAVIDEAAFTVDLIKTYTAMSPAMEYIQLISSPKKGEFMKFFIGLNK